MSGALRCVAVDELHLPPALLEEIDRAYRGPGRVYHGPAHLEEMARLFRLVQAESGWFAPVETFLAVLFHDAVYVPGAADNEARSAELASAAIRRFLPDAPTDLDRVSRLILLTAGHGHLAPEDVGDRDAALFLDCDMAILGASPAVFDAYHAGIAVECARLPRDVYERGRRAYLERLLEHDRIFLSDFFHARLDATARQNLRRALTPT